MGILDVLVLLVLQLTVTTSATPSGQLCNGDICSVSPEDFQQIQNIIGSNVIIILSIEHLNISSNNGFVVIENVSNLTISGGESCSQVIECSPQASFGFHIKNSSNITIEGLSISNCGSITPSTIEFSILHSQVNSLNETSLLIEASSNIVVSDVHIEESNGFGLIFLSRMNNMAESPFALSSGSHLQLTGSKISGSKEGSIVIKGNVMIKIETTVITNSKFGIMSNNSDIALRNVDIFNCSNSSFLGASGNVMVTEGLTINQSRLLVSDVHLYFHKSTTVFDGNGYQWGTFAYNAQIFIQDNSVITVTGFNVTDWNSPVLYIRSSHFNVRNNSTIIFKKNNIDYSMIIIYIYSTLNIVDDSSMVFNHNTIKNESYIVSLFFSTLVQSGGSMLFEDNYCYYHSHLIVTFDTNTSLLDESLVNITGNNIYTRSFIWYAAGASIDVDNSTLILNNNYLLASNGLHLFESSFVMREGGMFYKRNTLEYVSGLVVFYNSTTHLKNRSVVSFTQTKVNKMPYLIQIGRGFFEISESSLNLYGNVFADKTVGIYIVRSNIVINEGELLFEENVCTDNSFLVAILYADTTLEALSLIHFSRNEIYEVSHIMYIKLGSLHILNQSFIIFTGNTVRNRSSLLSCENSVLRLNKGKLTFEQNLCYLTYFANQLKNTNTTFENGSQLIFTRNKMEGGYGFMYKNGTWEMTPESKLVASSNYAKSGILLTVNSTHVLFGEVRIANNNFSDYGVLYIFTSTAGFDGRLEVVGNRGEESGGIASFASELAITNAALFSGNYGVNGGAMTLYSSVLYISPNASVTFTGNQAKFFGGAIYIYQPNVKYIHSISTDVTVSATICSLQGFVLNHSHPCTQFSIMFDQNRAGIAGNAIYGGHTLACISSGQYYEDSICPASTFDFSYSGLNDSSDLSTFTSDSTRVCFCENRITPNCSQFERTIVVHPGEGFSLSLAVVGYGLGTVPGSVVARGSGVSDNEKDLLGSELENSQVMRGLECMSLGYSVVSERSREQISLAVQMESFVYSFAETEAIVKFWMNSSVGLTAHQYDSFHEKFFDIPVFVSVGLLPCPVAFQLVNGRCVCHWLLQDNSIHSCTFSNGTALILRPAPYWIGLPNDTNSSILIHPHCPYDYCQSEDVNITVESPNTLCRYQRSGVLCGSCSQGLSMILGSSECRTCSNIYLVSISLFVIMGLALVAVVTLPNMTVSVGTLNALILFANILQANKATFLPPTTSKSKPLVDFLSAFIAWLNLDLGIPMCFYDGLTTYVKTWLQFVFPLYILVLVVVIIIASNYSSRVTRILGTNSVSVLATLVLLSYTKILRVLITAFSFTTVTGSGGYTSVVWLADGNIKYFELKHAVLFLFALLVLLILGLPYTVSLTAAPWIQRSEKKWVSTLYNKFKPLFDAYMGPYKDSYRYWTGMLLLARVVLIVLFSSVSNTNTVAGPQLNLLLLSLSCLVLVYVTATYQPYREKQLNRLEIFHLSLLSILSSTNLYISSIGTGMEARHYVYIVFVGACFLLFLGVCAHHVLHKVKTALTGRRGRRHQPEEQDWYPMWRVAGVRPEVEDKREDNATMSTAASTLPSGGKRDSVADLIADLPE